ncbi:MAG: sigma-70 family RNA polymerase sigma factor, partial [Veillonella parvula]
MLYTNEEPLVQKTCIKTANLQHDNYQSKKLETQALPSHSLLSKADESSRSIPEKLKLQTLICGHQVLSSLSDKSLVSICQKPNMRIQTVGYQPWSVDELRHDAAQIELCRRYRPLILHYTNRMGNREFREDVESYLWAILIESMYSFDLEGPV